MHQIILDSYADEMRTDCTLFWQPQDITDARREELQHLGTRIFLSFEHTRNHFFDFQLQHPAAQLLFGSRINMFFYAERFPNESLRSLTSKYLRNLISFYVDIHIFLYGVHNKLRSKPTWPGVQGQLVPHATLTATCPLSGAEHIH